MNDELDKSPWNPQPYQRTTTMVVQVKETGYQLPSPLPTTWPKPRDVRAVLAPVPQFSAAMLPCALRDWVMDISNRMQCPPDYAAVTAMVVLATLVGRRVQVQPKVHDDFRVTPNLWGMIIGPPSALKSPAMAEIMKPLHEIESALGHDYEDRLKEHRKREEVLKIQKDVAREELRKALRAKREATHSDLPDELEEPKRRRIIVVDTTVEKLGELLRDNQRGLLIHRDELAGWFSSMEKDGREADRAFYLEAWNGNSSFRYDRISRGTVDIECACLSMIGTIQPGILINKISGALTGKENDGLVQRFQLMVYPDAPEQWTYVDRTPDSVARKRAYDVLRRLDSSDLVTLGATLGDSDTEPRLLRFSEADGAQALIAPWYTALQRKIVDPDEHPLIQEHLGKYRSLMPSIAALAHLADVAAGLSQPGPISIEATQVAIAWCDYLEAHARRVYGSAIARSISAAKTLSAKIQKQKLRDGFTTRDVYECQWHGLTSKEDAQRAIEALEDLDWLRGQDLQTGGRPKRVYYINPHVQGSASDEVADDE